MQTSIENKWQGKLLPSSLAEKRKPARHHNLTNTYQGVITKSSVTGQLSPHFTTLRPKLHKSGHWNQGQWLLILSAGLSSLMLLSNWPTLTLAGSCRDSQLCCNGRDSSCVVQKAPINALIENLNDKPCYCDHACLRLDDCCNDFKDYCSGKNINYIYTAKLLYNMFYFLGNVHC